MVCAAVVMRPVTSITVANLSEWHRPCVQTPVERDGVVGFKLFCIMFPHTSAGYLVFMWSAYFLNAT